MITFSKVELYRSSVDLTTKDRAWCDANATLLYQGTATSYNNSGLTESTRYYYKIFTVYTDGVSLFYSSGVSSSAKTEVTPVDLYQKWENYEDSPLLTSDYHYQCIYTHSGGTMLIMCNDEITQRNGRLQPLNFGTSVFVAYGLVGSTWTYATNSLTQTQILTGIAESNTDIYTVVYVAPNFVKTTLYFAQTTP
jgi:hypothetical protein